MFQRTKMTRAILFACALTAFHSANAQDRENTPVPERAWAHKHGIVDLQPSNPEIVQGRLLDHYLIQDAFSRWGIAFDEDRVDVIESLFTQDAQLIGLEAGPDPVVSANGREQILEVVRQASVQQNDQRRHVISNIVIEELTDNTARAIAYGIIPIANNGLFLGATVIYSADLKKEGDAWRFSRLAIAMDNYAGQVPNPDLTDTPPNNPE